MAGNNILVAAAISPQVLASQQLAASEAAIYTVPAATSAKLATGTLCNVTNLIAPPVLALGTTSTTGGTLAAGTYFWKVTAKSASGETLASNEVTATTTGSTSSQPLSWPAVAGAASYNVYRGTATGAENLLISNLTGTSFTDIGGTGTTVAPPTVNSYGFAVLVYLSIVKTGGTIGDGTHRVVSGYSLAAGDTLSLRDYIAGAMLGPGDVVAGYSSIATSVDFVMTGTVHS